MCELAKSAASALTNGKMEDMKCYVCDTDKCND